MPFSLKSSHDPNAIHSVALMIGNTTVATRMSVSVLRMHNMFPYFLAISGHQHLI